MSAPDRPVAKGRGSQIKPPNRFESVHSEDDFEQAAEDDTFLEGLRSARTQYISDESLSIVSENDSPDIPFRLSVNPHRGCSHGWIYWLVYPRSVNLFDYKDLRPDSPRFRKVGR